MTRKTRTHAIQVYLTDQEFDSFNTGQQVSTCPTQSAYIRKLLFGRPVTVRHRNQSLDDLMTELIPLRAELNSISLNFNQVAGKLHLLRNLGQLDGWLSEHEADWKALDAKITEIKSTISQIDDIWLQ